jgi:hypothetical protein
MKRIAIFSILVLVFLSGVVAAETFDTEGKISEDGITFNAKKSFSLSGDYKTTGYQKWSMTSLRFKRVKRSPRDT